MDGAVDGTRTAPGDGTGRAARRVRAAAGDGPALRSSLADAAYQLVLEHRSGSAVTVRRVAERAGVSLAAIYLHFSSREELLYEAAYAAFRDHMDRADQAVELLDDPMDRIEQRGRDWVGFAMEWPDLFHTLFMAEPGQVPDRYEGLAMSTTGLGPLIADLAAAMDAGTIARADTQATAAMLWMTVHGVASLLTALPHFPWPPGEVLTESMLAFTRRALVTPPPDATPARHRPGRTP